MPKLTFFSGAGVYFTKAKAACTRTGPETGPPTNGVDLQYQAFCF